MSKEQKGPSDFSLWPEARQLGQSKKSASVVDRRGDWTVYDSKLTGDLLSYNSDFGLLVAESGSKDIKDFLEEKFRHKYGSVVGLDLGGTGDSLFADFSKGFIKKSFGVVLHDDLRSRNKPKEETPSHSVIVADIFSKKGLQQVEASLGGVKADVIFERMVGGTSNFPVTSPDFLFIFLKRWYALLGERGIMFLESPETTNAKAMEAIKKAVDKLQQDYKGQIDLKYKNGKSKTDLKIDIKIEKMEDAPQNL